MKRPTHAQLLAAITYDPLTGLFKKPGGIACPGNPDRKGYMLVSVHGYNYRAHRLAWFYMTGEWPPQQIDHINCVYGDNRWANLRLCTRSQNNHNQPMRKTNTSGVKGVCWVKPLGKWQGQVCLNYRIHRTETFSDITDAEKAVRELRESLHGDFAHHG